MESHDRKLTVQLYDFYHKNIQGRLEFITDKIRYDYYANFMVIIIYHF